MSIRWDPLLARHTALELERALAGARLSGLRLDGEARRLGLLCEDRALLWDLHPRAGWPSVTAAAEPAPGDLELRGRLEGVECPADERILRFRLTPLDGRPRALVVELLGNQWNALLLEGEPAIIRHVLVRREGARVQRVGEPYRAPEPTRRAGVSADVGEPEWTAALSGVPEEERSSALVRTFAWTSSLNAAALLAAADLGETRRRWRRLLEAGRASEPVVLELASGPHPYPFPLPGVRSRSVPSLLAGFEVARAAAPEARGATLAAALDPGLWSGLEGALRRARGRLARLEAELAANEDPAALRACGDLILARYAEIPHGAGRARLTAFDGGHVEVELDPAQPPHANAAAYYQRATKAERAAERLPALLAEARAARDRLEHLLERARAGAADEAEIRAALGGSAARRPTGPREAGAALPYRVFRSSGGLEIRVGRGAKHNDDLTFGHSAPGDVWLHARHVGGAHVILRWSGPGNPPSRDLAEAATLAALHSKARTSASVPVDWTFRRYVRKPRKAPPGRVAADRVETLFVRPDERVSRALADESPAENA
jgi:hypothetical protein